jgi:ATP-binding cassette subfamily B protein
MDNIRIGRKGASDEEVLAAAKAAMCDDFVSALPEGYGTVIGENGGKLSGGERQRISIARAILKDAPIIIMDEATASLDTESESKVQEALSRLISEKTVIIIAHRMRTVENADKIVVLSGGKVAEVGSPSYLKDKGGIFSRMVSLQTDSGDWSL